MFTIARTNKSLTLKLKQKKNDQYQLLIVKSCQIITQVKFINLDLCTYLTCEWVTLQSQLDEKDLMYLACACFVGEVVQELALSEGANNNRVFNTLFKK